MDQEVNSLRRRAARAWAVAVCVLGCGHASAQPLLDQPSITLEAAVKMVNACESLAKSKGWKVSIWVVDENEVAVHMKHMEGAPLEGIKTALMKAKTSKIWLSSSDPADAKSPIGKMIKEPRGQIVSVLLDSIPEGGGVPVMVGGRFVGAIGVSGTDGPSDAQCAQAGVDAILKK